MGCYFIIENDDDYSKIYTIDTVLSKRTRHNTPLLRRESTNGGRFIRRGFMRNYHPSINYYTYKRPDITQFINRRHEDLHLVSKIYNYSFSYLMSYYNRKSRRRSSSIRNKRKRNKMREL